MVDPQVRQILRAARSRRGPSLIELGAVQARAQYERTAPLLDVPREPLASVDDHRLELPGRTLPMRRYTPRVPDWTAPQPALVWFHGGGFTIGSIDTHDRLCRRLAHLSGCALVSVGYRLAPEHRFPAAADDACDAVVQIARIAPSLGLDPDRLAVGGDSAGGTLAAVAAWHAARQRLALRLQVLAYPGTSSHQDSPSHAAHADGYLLDADLIHWFFSNYLRDEADRLDPRFAPLRMPWTGDEARHLAPAALVLARLDPLLDEGLQYAQHLRDAGVPVQCRVFDGMVHAFLQHGGLVDAVAHAHRFIADAMIAALQLEPADG